MSLANYHFFLFFIERFSPIGICSLIAGEFVAMDDIMDNIKSLGMYIITVTDSRNFHSLYGHLAMHIFYRSKKKSFPSFHSSRESSLDRIGNRIKVRLCDQRVYII